MDTVHLSLIEPKQGRLVDCSPLWKRVMRGKLGMGSKCNRPLVGIEIRKLKRAGLPLNVRSVKHRALYSHALRLFGSWGKAIRFSGIDYDKIRIYRSWTKAFILKWIRRQWKLGHDVRPCMMERKEAALYAAACRRFGGWYPAIRASGIRGFLEVKRRRWDEEKLIRALRELGPETPYTEIRAKDEA